MSGAFDQSFWDDEESDLWESLFEIVFGALLMGIENGANILPSGAKVWVDWDLVNRNVQDYAARYRYDWIRKITETTRDGVQKSISGWIESGQPLSALETQLEAWFSPARAARIAATEVTRVFAEGNREAWESTGLVERMVWMTAEDELVCPVCGELDGMEIGIGDVDAVPPAHPNCRCWLKPVVDETAFEQKLDDILK